MTEQKASPEQIEREIESTRADINQTIDALQDKLSPGQLLDQVIGYAKEGGGEFAGNFGRTVRDNPVPLALMGISLAWLMASGRGGGGDRRRLEAPSWPSSSTDNAAAPGVRERGAGMETPGATSSTYSGTAQGSSSHESDSSGVGPAAAGQIKSSVSDAARGAGEKGKQIGEKAGEMASRAGDRASDMASRAGSAISDARDEAGRRLADGRDAAGEYADRARSGMLRARDATGRFARENPLAMGAIALAAGATIAALLPSTRREHELMGEHSDKLKEQAKDAASEQVDKAKAAATAARDAAKEEMARDGFTAEGAKESAKQAPHTAARAVEAAAKAAKEEVSKGSASPGTTSGATSGTTSGSTGKSSAAPEKAGGATSEKTKSEPQSAPAKRSAST